MEQIKELALKKHHNKKMSCLQCKRWEQRNL